MTDKLDLLTVSLPDLLDAFETDPSLIGKNAERLKAAIKRERGRTDEDLDDMSREELIDEIKKLRAGVRSHRDSSGHDLCWYLPELWSLLPEQDAPSPEVPPCEEFLERCVKYRASLDKK